MANPPIILSSLTTTSVIFSDDVTAYWYDIVSPSKEYVLLPIMDLSMNNTGASAGQVPNCALKSYRKLNSSPVLTSVNLNI